jgi:hypothetical protein
MMTPVVLYDHSPENISDCDTPTWNCTKDDTPWPSQRIRNQSPSDCFTDHATPLSPTDEDVYETIFDDPASGFVIVEACDDYDGMAVSDDADDGKEHHETATLKTTVAQHHQQQEKEQPGGMVQSVLREASWLSSTIRRGVSRTARSSWEWLAGESKGEDALPSDSSLSGQPDISVSSQTDDNQTCPATTTVMGSDVRPGSKATTTPALVPYHAEDALASPYYYSSSSLHEVAIATAIARTVRSGGNQFVQRTKYQMRRMVRAGGSALKSTGRQLLGLETKYNVFGAASLFVIEALQPFRSEHQIAEEAAIELTS